MYRRFGKRLFDLTIATFALIVLVPLLVFILILNTILHKGSPFFFQLRSGFEGRLFRIVKFKTMSDARDSRNSLLPDHLRITKFGHFLRRTSLDELPQLWNVLTGDMSLIGPRPLLPEYLALYSKHQKLRHSVKPGITGWAQVHGRNEISWEQKFDHDVWYTRHFSFSLDLKIIILTIRQLSAPASNNPDFPEKFVG